MKKGELNQMEGKPRHLNPEMPYTVEPCQKCGVNIVITAQGHFTHKCQK